MCHPTDPVVPFVHDLDHADLPDEVVQEARRCLVDLVGVAAAGTRTALSRTVRAHVTRHYGATERGARLLFDGRAVSPPGAALANAATIDSMDGHDGHRGTKGHAGAAVLPAALALLDGAPGADGRELLTCMVVGYEVATRAGLTLHANAADYHSSGAWNALGAAAVAARALGLGPTATAHALGTAEYHAPRAPMMRCVDHPTMVKDSSACGAHAGVTAALLAADGFTGAPAQLTRPADGADPDEWASLGTRWRILEHYRKPYPVCRWAHPAVRAVTDLVTAHDLTPDRIAGLTVTTFHPATRLASRAPRTTEEAQYSLPFSVAAAAAHPDPRALTAAVAEPDRVGPDVRRLARELRVVESAELTAGFPEQRRAEVTVTGTDGQRLSSGPTTAVGDPELPLPDRDLEAKFHAAVAPLLNATRAHRLLGLLRRVEDHTSAELLDEVPTDAG